MSDTTLPPSPGFSEGPTRAADPEMIGPYRVLERLGQGGMGTVYLGKHTQTGLVAAVKVLPASLAREEGFVERFNREIDAMRKLSNEYTVKLYDSGVDGDIYYYSMEYVEGETLMALLKREKRLPWQRAVEITIQVCHALKAAHDTGIIHRDLKPSNLLLTIDGSVKLTDFGVAQVFAANRLTVTGGIIGTAEFMSPEQAQGQRATKQSDLYSLGAVLYCMVTGRPPFSGNTAVEIIQKHRYGQFDRAKTYVPDIPSWLDDVIAQLLDKDTAKRFPDAYVLVKRLENEVRKSEYRQQHQHSSPDAPTIAGDNIPPGDTRIDAGSAGGIGPATLARNVVRATLSDAPGSWLSQQLERTPVQVTLLCLTLGLVTWLSWPKAQSPQHLYDQAVAALDEEPGPGWLAARDHYIKPLLAHPDSGWKEQAQELDEQVALYDATRRSLAGRSSLKPSEANRSEPLRLIQQGMTLQRGGQFAEAEHVLAAVSRMLEQDPANKDLAKLVAKLADRAREEGKAVAQRRGEWVLDALRRADAAVSDGDLTAARGIWSSLVDLYANDAELADSITTARKKLEQSAGPAAASQKSP